MGTNWYNDSHGERWGVMIQQKHMSCGPASVAMTEVYYKQRVVADVEARIREISQKYPGRFTETGGTYMKNLAYVLREEGIKCYDPLYTKAVWSYLYAYAKDDTPIIVQIDWKNGGSHFAVCVYVYKTDQKCIFLDPWYGLIERAGSTLPDYTIGTPEFGTSPGTLNGWILLTRPS
jgi:hypothetical protein